MRGDNARAVIDYANAVGLEPDWADAHFGLGMARCNSDQMEQGMADLAHTLKLNPDHSVAHSFLARTLRQLKRNEEALRHYREAVRLHSEDPDDLNSLAWFLAVCEDDRFRDGPAARQLAEKACALSPEPHFMYLDTLAAALAECGEFTRAAEVMEQALRIVPREHKDDFRERLRTYRAGKPYRE